MLYPLDNNTQDEIVRVINKCAVQTVGEKARIAVQNGQTIHLKDRQINVFRIKVKDWIFDYPCVNSDNGDLLDEIIEVLGDYKPASLLIYPVGGQTLIYGNTESLPGEVTDEMAAELVKRYNKLAGRLDLRKVSWAMELSGVSRP